MPRPADENLPETVLAAYRRINRIRLTDMAKALGVSQQQCSRYCLPRKHKNHDRPGPQVSDRLRDWTDGEVTVANYSDPYLPIRQRSRRGPRSEARA